jgi:magnesium and cobalt exporter, CNNM family
MTVGISLMVILALILVNGFFVAAEFSIVTVRKTRVDQLIAEGSRFARPVRRALNNPTAFIAATQLGITMTSLGLGWIGEPALANAIQPAFSVLPIMVPSGTAHTVSAAIAFAIITALTIVLGELAPKTIALQRAEQTAMIVVKPTELFQRAFNPFIRALNAMGRAVVNLLGLREPSGHGLVHSEEELKMLVTASQEAGVLEEDEEQMLHRVFHFADYAAAEMMIPRTEMMALRVDASLAEVVDVVVRGRYTSLPVYRSEVDNVIGIVLVTDLVRVLAASPQTFNLAALAREALTVPETMKADELLRQMRRHRTHQAIVIDEYGATAGIVTFERVMERIVGQHGGDFDAAVRPVTQLPDGSAEVDGLALVSDINEQFGLDVDDETYSTIGGFILGSLGRRPTIGDSVEVGNRHLTVVALDGLRVARVRIQKVDR